MGGIIWRERRVRRLALVEDLPAAMSPVRKPSFRPYILPEQEISPIHFIAGATLHDTLVHSLRVRLIPPNEMRVQPADESRTVDAVSDRGSDATSVASTADETIFTKHSASTQTTSSERPSNPPSSIYDGTHLSSPASPGREGGAQFYLDSPLRRQFNPYAPGDRWEGGGRDDGAPGSSSDAGSA